MDSLFSAAHGLLTTWSPWPGAPETSALSKASSKAGAQGEGQKPTEWCGSGMYHTPSQSSTEHEGSKGESWGNHVPEQSWRALGMGYAVGRYVGAGS